MIVGLVNLRAWLVAGFIGWLCASLGLAVESVAAIEPSSPVHSSGGVCWCMASLVDSSAGTSGDVGLFRGSPFVVPGIDILDGNQSLSDAVAVRRSSPHAFWGRISSDVVDARLDAVRARAVVKKVFPGLVGESAGGPPRLPTGERVVAFPSDNVEQVAADLGGHVKRGVVESVEPIALHHKPIDLQLVEADGSFGAVRSAVAVRVPRRLREGVTLGSLGVSLTPLNAREAPASSEGVIDGKTVAYANSLADSDTLVKPTTFGFSVETVLRSVEAPRQLRFRVGMPGGARLVDNNAVAGIEVVRYGKVLAVIKQPTARDAEGTDVPVSTSVLGHILTVTVVPLGDGAYKLPVVVDPSLEDITYEESYYYETLYHTNWRFETQTPPERGYFWDRLGWPRLGGTFVETISGGHSASEWGGLFYTTRGASEIIRAHVEGEWNDTGFGIQNYMVLYAPKESKGTWTEDYDPLPVATEPGWGGGGYACAPELSCPETFAGGAAMENGNEAGYEQISTEAGKGGAAEAKNEVTNASVTVSQTQGPTLEFNKSSPTIYNSQTKEYVSNVLYSGGESWLGPHHGAFEVRAKDPGLGLKLYRVLGGGTGETQYYYATGKCTGIQCPEYKYQGYAYAGEENGEDSFEAFAEDPVGLYAHIYPQKIKVDHTPPKITLSGFVNGNELASGETHIKVEATDGEGPTKSSGVKSIKLTTDGNEIPMTATSCSEGPCTASTEAKVFSRDYSSGVHSLIVTATDNAENVSQEEVKIRVHAASQLSAGPGSVDPSSGELTLSASDASLGGTTGISRVYRSRHLAEGAEGPLGPQWKINIGGGEGLAVLPEGTATVTSSGGASTTFFLNKKNKYESPKGDSNLKLEAKEKEVGKGISEYVLSDPTAGTKTRFEQPGGVLSAPPAFASGFGAEAGKLKHPVSDAIDAAGDVWATNAESDLLEKFSAAGTLLATYGAQGSEAGSFSYPWGVAIDPRNGNVYVTDQGNNRVEEFSSAGTFIKMFGWGVSNGSSEFQICTKECKPGIAGTGNGQFRTVAGVAVDTSGNAWIADYGNNRIEEFNEKGEYVQKFGSTGKGAGQYEGPLNTTFSGGNVYVTDSRNDRVQELSTTGAFIRMFGWGVSNGSSEFQICTKECRAGIAGSGSGQFSDPYGAATEPRSGNLYVVDSGNARVQEFTASGVYVTTFGLKGTEEGQFGSPAGIAVANAGGVYVVDSATDQVLDWVRASWVPTEAGGPLAAGATTYSYTTVEEEGKPVIQPSEALAPVPFGVSCSPTLERGCRALTFNYASTTTATGEDESEWGDYKGHVTRVYLHAWDPAKGAMSETEIVRYLYDKQGRLRAEWDPRIATSTACGGSCSALKTIYGYDAAGHVTAVSVSGSQPWLLHYGTIAGDTNKGRLLSVIRPSSKTTIGTNKAPQVTTEPTLSTTSPRVGEAVSINKGTWGNSPLTYSYQWEDCKYESVGENLVLRCEAIAEAVNQSYTPLTRDRGKLLRATVTASNAIGATAVCTAEKLCIPHDEVGGTGELSEEPLPGVPATEADSVSTIEYAVPVSGSHAPQQLGSKEVEAWAQKDDPVEGAAVFPPDSPQGWPAAHYTRATISYWDSQGKLVNTATPSGGIATTEYNTADDVVRSLSATNRETALKEGSKSAEVSKRLDTESHYNGETNTEEEHEEEEATRGIRSAPEPGTELLETRGPQHEVKLAEGGAEVLARNHVRYYYDEGSPEGKHYGLQTRTTDGAEYEGKEADIRTTRNYYSGQNGLGWRLRRPTSVVTDPTGLDLTRRTVYNETTGSVVETKMPGGTSENVSPPTYSTAFGKEGTGNAQFKNAFDAAVDSAGYVWVVDKNNHRVEKFSSTGSFVGAYGAEGTIGGDYEEAWGVAVNQNNGNVYVTDSSDNRIEELNSSGAFIETIGWGVSDGKAELQICKTSCRAGTVGEGNGQFNYPIGITIDAHGNLWVADDGNNRVQELTEAGAYVTKFGSYGTGNGQFNGSRGIAISEGDIYVVDHGNNRVEEFSPTGTYLNQFGSKGKGQGQFEGPAAIAVNPNSSGIYVSDPSEDKIEEYSPAGKFLVEFGMWGTGHDQFENPKGLAINASGDLYVTEEYGNRVDELAPPGAGGAHMTYSTQWGSAGAGEGQFYWSMMSAIDGSGNIWSTDLNNSRVEKFSPSGKFLASYGKWGTGEVQFKKPTGIAINQSTGNVYVADCENNRIEELSSTGTYVRTFGSGGTGVGQFNCPGGLKVDSSGNVWVADTKNNRIQEFSSTGTFTAYGSKGTGNGQFNEPTDIAISGSDIYVTDTGNDRVQELSTSGAYIAQFGSEGDGGGNFFSPQGIATDASGHLYVSDSGDGRIEQFTASGEYLASFGTQGSSEGQFTRPNGVAITSAGNMVVTDSSNNRIQLWANTNQAVHDTKTIYYTAKEEAEVATCRNHPEWAGLVCQTQPDAQPEDTPNLPVASVIYNIWDEDEKTTETFGAVTRTKTETYDPAGRALTSETGSSIDTALPKTTNEYSSETGALVKQSTESSGKTQSVISKINSLGQLIEYVDSDGNVTKYSYEEGENNDQRLTEVSEGKSGVEESKQGYVYNPTTGSLAELIDTQAGKKLIFTAEYNVEGRITAVGYPNGMTAYHVYNPAGEATGLEYVKKTHCSEKCTWFTDSATSSIHGELLAQTGSLAKEAYTYDAIGRLTQVQEEPSGKSCVDRIYSYDEESNRTSLTTREGSEGKCPTENGKTQRHVYDQADRLVDEGVSYETFGDITKLPASDAGNEHEITSSYYVDGQLESETQNGQTNTYHYDPTGRTREMTIAGKTMIDHYTGPGETVAWTSEGSGIWTRDITGIDGTLCATQTSTGSTTLQLSDLQGNAVATVGTSETETKLSSTYNSTEFGVPQPGTSAPKFSWQGASGLPTEFGSSGSTSKGGATYVPLIGRPLQTGPITSPGTFPNGGATSSVIQASYSQTAAGSIKQMAIEYQASQEAAARKQAEEEARLNECPASECGPWPEGGSEPEEPEGEGAPPPGVAGTFDAGCKAAAACAAGSHIYGPISCHFPWTSCHVDFTQGISKDILNIIYPNEGEESAAISLVCAIPALVSAEAAGALGFACAAVLAYYWSSFVDVTNHIHEWGGCYSIRYSWVPPVIHGVAADGGSGCVK